MSIAMRFPPIPPQQWNAGTKLVWPQRFIFQAAFPRPHLRVYSIHPRVGELEAHTELLQSALYYHCVASFYKLVHILCICGWKLGTIIDSGVDFWVIQYSGYSKLHDCTKSSLEHETPGPDFDSFVSKIFRKYGLNY